MRRAAKIKSNNSTDQKIDRLTQHVVQLIDVFESSQVQMPIPDLMNSEVIDIIMIMKFTGYDDIRSAKKWLLEQGFKLIEAGKKTYISSIAWGSYIKKQTEGNITSMNMNVNTISEKTTLPIKSKTFNLILEFIPE